ncbi:hypothetical protein NQ317_015506 [Molorchus minor]|uniref:Uncharacterized protein n=1 Tax=Molorchus minor TaxID=1323400 RepID=A0ABQ9JM63_9CUCU|nr:hypothetical protein NQ317_015506 [Molorchus minor]
MLILIKEENKSQQRQCAYKAEKLSGWCVPLLTFYGRWNEIKSYCDVARPLLPGQDYVLLASRLYIR